MTDTIPGDEVVIKADVLGRVRTSRERREQLLDEFEKSGLTGQKFAEVVGIKYQTFATWAQRRRRQRGDTAVDNVDGAQKFASKS
jgi:hypothetical protein